MTLRDEKLAVRAASLAARDALKPEHRARASAVIAERVMALPALASAKKVALFASIRSEVDSGPLDAALRARGIAVAYPRIVRSAIGETRTDLVFHVAEREELHAAEMTPVNPGSWRLAIPEPPDDPATILALTEIDVFLIPGVAYDDAHRRLGYGRGYYDRVLEKAPHALKVGIAFEAQIVPRVPTGPGDIPVNVIVTEEKVR
ncbi:MAG TPA: 5-formyltetrahydrofolate cyclo-ligase [bacterium]|nr:5-formyltetrahydrofolate cyclo-ligase [bacterium]